MKKWLRSSISLLLAVFMIVSNISFVRAETADDGSVTTQAVTVNQGATVTVTDNTGNYEDAVDKSGLDESIATVTVTGTTVAESSTTAEVDPSTATLASGTYLLVNTRCGKTMTSDAATWNSYSGMALDGTVDGYTDKACWIITATDTAGVYTVQDKVSGQYLTLTSSNNATLSTTPANVTIDTYTDDSGETTWRLSNGEFYLNNAGGEGNCAFGWDGEGVYSAPTDEGSQWAIHEVRVTPASHSTQIVFAGVAAGETSVQVGQTVYAITVVIPAQEHVCDSYVNGFCTLCDAYQPAADSDLDGIYEIGNAGQLYWFAELVKTDADANAVLTADIVVNEGTMTAESTDARVWETIGYWDSSKDYVYYIGTFDGQGHTVSGLYYNTSGEFVDQYIGLFGYVGAEAIIKNVSVANSFFCCKNWAGGIAGLSKGTITNCTNSATIMTDSGDAVGGIAGSNSGTISDCSNSGTISGWMYVGGIAGSNSGTVEDCTNSGTITYTESHGSYMGGIVGLGAGNGVITRCSNFGDVTGKSSNGGIGGIAGYCKTTNADNVITISQCYNTGDITGDRGVGGIVGYVETCTVDIDDCYNTGDITAVFGQKAVFAGGIAGRIETAGSTVDNCHNIGTVRANRQAGGIIGGSTPTITNCYYLVGCASDGSDTVQNGMGALNKGETTADTAATVAKTSEQFASGEVCYLLNGSTSEGETLVWFQTLTGEDADAYPVFEGKVVYFDASAVPQYFNEADHTHIFDQQVATEEYLATEAACEAAATYYYSCAVCGRKGTETFVSGEALGHAYGEPVIVWNEDNTASASVTCANDATHVEELEVTVTSETKAGDCETKAVTTYTATVTFQGETYTSTKTVEGELGECADTDKDHKCDVCGEVLSECVDENEDYKCDICGAELEKPVADSVIRLAGAHRWATSLMVADEMKANLGVEKFGSIIIASGNDFADALAGSYLSTVKSAPILLSWGKGGNFEYLDTDNIEYIKANLAEGGTVYILGGVNAVPELYEEALKGYNVKRLGGADRFETNLLILAEAGVEEGSEILVCTSTNFADSLSASATGKPILLVFNELGKLYGAQPEYLAGLKNCTFTVIGGESAVSADLAKAIETYGKVERLAGANRFETSVLVAEKYFEAPETAVLAYAWNYPDGLCGGSLAFSLKAPLVLTMTKYEAQAVEYATGNSITSGIVLGGDGLISDDAVRAVFAMDADDEIIVK